MIVWHRCGRRVMAALVLSLSAAVAIAGETVLKSGGSVSSPWRVVQGWSFVMAGKQ